MRVAGSTIAITGATGMVGRALCEYFSAKGARVRALARKHDVDLAALPGLSRVECDLPDRVAADALEGCEVVIHAAYTTRFRTLADAKRVNEEGTRRVLSAARRAGVTRFVFVSSTSAHEGARSYYGQSKYRLEQEMDAARDLIIRPGLVLSARGGLFTRLISGIKDARRWTAPVFGGGRQPLQVVHIDDLCEGFGKALERDLTGALTLASPERTDFRDLFEAIGKRKGISVRFVPLPIGPVLAGLRVAETARLRLPISSENLRGLLGLRHWETGEDLLRVGLRVRSMKEAIDAVISNPATP